MEQDGWAGVGWWKRVQLRQAAFSGRAVSDPHHADLVARYARTEADRGVAVFAGAHVVLCLLALALIGLQLRDADYALAAVWAFVLVNNLFLLVRLRGRRRRLLEAVEKNERHAA